MYVFLAHSKGPAPLSITLDSDELEALSLEGPNVIHPVDSQAGEIAVTAAAAGGDGSYAYAWTVAEVGDDDDIASGALVVLSAGTQNLAQYNSLTLRSTATPGPPVEATYTLTCTVTDGTGATASVNIDLRVFAINFG